MKYTILTLLVLSLSFHSRAQEVWTLQKCIDKAFQNNIQLKQGKLGLDMAKIDQQQAVGRALPSVNASATHGYNLGQRIDPFTNTFATKSIRSNSLGINSSITLFNGMQTYHTIKQSQLSLEASAEDIRAMENDVVLNVSSTYLTVLFNDELEKIAHANYLATEQQVERMEKLVQAGQLPLGKLSEIKAQLASDEASWVSAQNNTDLSYLALRQLMVLTPEESTRFSITGPNTDEVDASAVLADPRHAVEYALNNFPQIRSTDIGVEIAEKGVSIAKGAQSPRLGVSYSYGSGYSGAAMVGVGEPQLIDTPVGLDPETGEVIWDTQTVYTQFETKSFGSQIQDNVNQSLFFSLSIPLFNGFSTKSAMQRADVNLKNALYARESAKLKLEQEVQRAHADMKASFNNFKAAEKSAEAAQLALDYATVQFEQGVINFVDFNTAKTRNDNAQANLLRSKYDYLFKTKIMEFYQGKVLTFN